MKAFLYLLLCSLITSCATSNFTTVLNNRTAYPYERVVVVTIRSPNEFYQLDSSSYANVMQTTFNNVANFDFRKNLEKKLENSLGSQNTTIIKSSDLFPVNSEVSFNDFMSRIRSTNAEAILLVNLKGVWTRNSYSVNNNAISQDESPNSLFFGYLVDLRNNQPVWIAKSVVNGTVLTGYEALNGNFANRVANKLTVGYYIYAKNPSDQ